MKKLSLILLLLASACAPKQIIKADSTPDVVETKLIVPESVQTQTDKKLLEIKEKMFIAQINDIFYNIDDYKDTVVIVEGMYAEFQSVDGKSTSPAVYRLGPGCCENDGWAGFLLRLDDSEKPNENDWIRVKGTVDLVDSGMYKDLYLNVESIEVLQERGAETVQS